MELTALEQHLADGEFFIKFHIYISYFYYYSCILFIAKPHTSPVKAQLMADVRTWILSLTTVFNKNFSDTP